VQRNEGAGVFVNGNVSGNIYVNHHPTAASPLVPETTAARPRPPLARRIAAVRHGRSLWDRPSARFLGAAFLSASALVSMVLSLVGASSGGAADGPPSLPERLFGAAVAAAFFWIALTCALARAAQVSASVADRARGATASLGAQHRRATRLNTGITTKAASCARASAAAASYLAALLVWCRLGRNVMARANASATHVARHAAGGADFDGLPRQEPAA